MNLGSKATICVTVLISLLLPHSLANASNSPSQAGAGKTEKILIQASEITYKPAPGLPEGAQIAVIRGDLKKAGLFTLRLKLPDCYVIPAHWHTNDEEVTVLSGTFNAGFGDKIDKGQAKALSAGGFQIVPGKANHF